MARRAFGRSLVLAAIGLPIIGLALMAVKAGYLDPYSDNVNYRIVYSKPSGPWKALPHGPQTLFLYQNTKSHVLLRGAVSQIISELNPTPELDTDGIAQFYIDRTHDNMPDWSAEMLDSVRAQNARFRIIRRTKRNKEVVTAYAVKGNTTLMVSLSGNSNEVRDVESTLPVFRNYLTTITLKQQDMSAM